MIYNKDLAVFDGNTSTPYSINEMVDGKVELILDNGQVLVFDSPSAAYEHVNNINKSKKLSELGKQTEFIFS